MLVSAGYFNYITFNNEAVETSSEQTDVNQTENQENSETTSEEVAQNNQNTSGIGDAVLVNSNTEQTQNVIQENQTSKVENINLDEKEPNKDDVDNDYYVNSKLQRDKMYAEMLSNYQEILNNTNCSEPQKTIATQEIAKINNNKNAIMICENLILTKKEFQNCVILINDSNVNVVVNINSGLNQESVAKIQNIVSREMKTPIENIHITEK